MAEGIRLDLFLWFARLAKTRPLAQAIIAEGHLRLDGRATSRAHATVRVGSVLALPLHGRVRVFRVLALPARRGPAEEARMLYADLSPGAADPPQPPTMGRPSAEIEFQGRSRG